VGSASFQGGPSSNIAGLIYLPHEDALFRGNPNSSCSLIIADTIQLQGNSTFTLTGLLAGERARRQRQKQRPEPDRTGAGMTASAAGGARNHELERSALGAVG
jgi:hypothetical protein